MTPLSTLNRAFLCVALGLFVAFSTPQTSAAKSCQKTLASKDKLKALKKSVPEAYGIFVSKESIESDLSELIHELRGTFSSLEFLVGHQKRGRFRSRFKSQKVLRKSVRKQLKTIKRTGDRIRAFYYIYSQNHTPPAKMDRFVKKAGLIVDLMDINKHNAALKQVRVLVDRRNVWYDMERTLGSFNADKPKKISNYVYDELQKASDILKSKSITVYELHYVKKVFRRIHLLDAFSRKRPTLKKLFSKIPSQLNYYKGPVLREKLRGGNGLKQTQFEINQHLRKFLLRLISNFWVYR